MPKKTFPQDVERIGAILRKRISPVNIVVLFSGDQRFFVVADSFEFVVPSEVARVPGRPTFRFGDVNGTAENVKHGLGFIFFVKDGALASLAGYTYDEPWPNEIGELKLTYSEGPIRNMDKLRKLLHEQ
jgi:hypothetical protein